MAVFAPRHCESAPSRARLRHQALILGRAIAQQIDFAKPGQVLELGPGTGRSHPEILTHGVVPARLTVSGI